jgi:hypothetical protein
VDLRSRSRTRWPDRVSARRQRNRFYKRIEPDWEKATEVFPELPDLAIEFDVAAGTGGRQFAFYELGSWTITFSPRIVKEPAHRQKGIFRHELGHLIHDYAGRELLASRMEKELPESDEVLADEIAGFVFDAPILYDDETVQSVSQGKAQRPEHLG